MITRSAALFLLEQIRTGVLNGASLRLYKNNLVPSPGTVLGDLTEADYSGYAAAVVATWGDVFIDQLLQVVTVAPSQQFNHSGGAVVNEIFGWYVTAATGELVIAVRLSTAPVLLDSADKSLVVLASMVYPVG